MGDKAEDLKIESLTLDDTTDKTPEVSGRPAAQVSTETSEGEETADSGLRAPPRDEDYVEDIPFGLKTEFVYNVVGKKYKNALKLANIMLKFDPGNKIAKEYLPVLEQAIELGEAVDDEESSSSEEESSSEESSSEEESDEEDPDVPGTSKATIKPPRVRNCRIHNDRGYLDGKSKP
ncbi:Oidioi.mRNA.OKI2018_I69.chr1.g2687.t1.cds [Oikopleura dioica]|uniref:Oidioi.mRNA.OKI2018_I69.chr1.g2687.t1.cds n=1 Tax=Oikopleura dioica TaxID=34765 RepID=A0ABN7SY92_OIKDI|nr:Oidioi.mRNA.OKI2018_I69.chr1.g2687.t1.cds [Oikopleura dioica]